MTDERIDPQHDFQRGDTAEIDPQILGLALAGFPLIILLMRANAQSVAMASAMLVLFLIALRLLARGQELARALRDDPSHPVPRLPRKTLGSGILGVLVALQTISGSDNTILAMLLGVITTGLALTAFGPDPKHGVVPQPLNDTRHGAASQAATSSGLAQTEAQAPEVDSMAKLVSEIDDMFCDVLLDLAELDDSEISDGVKQLRDTLLDRLIGKSTLCRSATDRTRRLMALLTDETDRLFADLVDGRGRFARQRYLAKLAVMTQTAAQMPLPSRNNPLRAATERKADDLFDRMMRETAA